MKIVYLICRVLMGLGFVVFGANILHPFLPQPPFPEGSMTAQFMGLFFQSHWIILIGVCQLLGGLFVLSGRLAPLGLVILAPVLVNIIAFHIYLQEGEGLAPGLVFTTMELILIFGYRKNFSGIWSTTAEVS